MTTTDIVNTLARNNGEKYFNSLVFSKEVQLDLAIRLSYETGYKDGHAEGFVAKEGDLRELHAIILQQQREIQDKNQELREQYRENLSLKEKLQNK